MESRWDGVRRPLAPRIAELVEDGAVSPLNVEGLRETRYVVTGDLPSLDTIASDRIPEAWIPLRSTTEEEVTLLAPLDNVVWDRARCLALFKFEYVWEVYKPEPRRTWGYYTLPVLWEDRIVARIYPHADRKTETLHIRGFWPELSLAADDSAFLEALAAGVARLARLNRLNDVDVSAINPRRVRQRLRKAVGKAIAGTRTCRSAAACLAATATATAAGCRATSSASSPRISAAGSSRTASM